MSFYRPGGSGSGSVTTTPVSVAEGGTGATNATDARNNLGISATGADTNYAFRSNNLSDLNSASNARTNLGLGSIATQAASNVSISGGSITGITDLAVADGGTGASTAAGALENLLPSYSSNANKVLSVKSDATGVEWTTNGAGTVTSVDATVPTGLAISGNPITSSGTLAFSYAAGYSIPTDTKQGNWDTAYGWGNHASAGYAKYGDTTANFTGTLQQNSSNVLVASNIGSSVQAYDADTTKNDVANTFTTNQIISTSSTDAALRITQTGTGNALLVEDSTNPDATPFVVAADGRVVIGTTSAITPLSGYSPQVQQSGTTTATSAFGINRFSADASPPTFLLGKSRATTIGSYDVVSSGDALGRIYFAGADGTAEIVAAQIDGFVDGTPGTNDMPGRLVFSTTADGASSPTERMRITSSGAIGIGGTPAAGRNFVLTSAITGSTTSRANTAIGTVQSDVTNTASYYATSVSVQDAAFALTNLSHFEALQGTISGGSRLGVTNQYGFNVGSSLTGATNNYGFYSNIASGTGRYNFYANGTAVNYFAGNVGIGSGKAAPATALDVNGTVTATAFEGTIEGGTYA